MLRSAAEERAEDGVAHDRFGIEALQQSLFGHVALSEAKAVRR